MNKTGPVLKISLVISIIALITVAIYCGSVANTMAFKKNTHNVIIDAGHGLPDGGAVAPDGTIESDINLAIAQLIYDKLSAAGFNCIMTRTDKNSIFTEGKTIHAKKVSDTKQRVEISKKYEDALVLSIHMNTYTTPNVHGMQTFYKSGSEISKSIAAEIQTVMNLKYQPENTKVSKPIPSNVYLFSHINNNSVLAECGFLTNSDDLAKLKSTQFQDSLAKSIAEVVIYKLSGSELNAN